jgi:hypothetical protein
MSNPRSSSPSFGDTKELDQDMEQGRVTENEADNKVSTSLPETLNPYHPSQFPDGGKDAWLCLLGVSEISKPLSGY